MTKRISDTCIAVQGCASQRQAEKRHELLDSLWRGLGVVAVIGATLSASRAIETGWLALYGLHVALGVVVLVVVAFLRRLAFRTKLVALVAVFWIVGVAGVLRLGLLGAGVWWLVLSTLLFATFHTLRAAVIAAGVAAAVVAAAGAAFVTGRLSLPVDANTYVVNTTSWATLLIATTFMPYAVIRAVYTLRQNALDLLREVQEQRDAIAEIAFQDPLTGLPTRRLADDRLEMAVRRARRTGNGFTLLCVDLDGFKSVNDRHGHSAGDCLLRAIASRLSASVRAEDTVARLGGDEFMILLPRATDQSVVERLARTLIDSVSAPLDYEGQLLEVGASIGVAMYPQHADDGIALREAADRAMYRAKRQGKNQAVTAEPVDVAPAIISVVRQRDCA